MNAFLLAATQIVQSPTTVADPTHHESTWGIAWGSVLIMLVGFAIWALIIVTLIRLFKFLGSARKEQQLFRFELGKLAEEVHLLSEKLKGKEQQ